MAKQYRKPTNEVTIIYGGRSPAGRDTLNPKDVLPNGMTAKQHCEKLIAERGGKGHFIEKNSELEDVCMLHSCSYFGGCYEAAEYSYHYALCTEIEFTATLNGKATTAKELAALKGGERVIITANQDVAWSANDNKKLEKVAINPTTYSFTMPKVGSFTIKATGKCDPKASKSVTVAVKTTITSPAPKPQFPKDKFIDELYKAMDEFSIKEKNDRAAFLANVEHETMGFKSLSEGQGLKYTFKNWKTINKNTKNWAAQKGMNAESEFNKLSEQDKINIMYRNMIGNNKPNDGWEFRGRGAIQLTGRGNYQGFANYAKRPDIMTNPNLIATDIILAARASAWFWKKGSQASTLALKGDFRKSRLTVNHGRGMEETLNFINRYLSGKGSIPLYR
ncbi:glycoside hydrolase family 19 protein [Alysiella filiformis]|uniref:Predicted chitinase n=1 Tax=Alysiella filiformis DSM 16848 TaxID=1120981 RepID=A0A286E9H8_9NEIS|nr:glycoside hydrolase family 19 protein [Alysiella filiformis]QMT31410.1 hypothetical protein H3L97_00380 [Alysiella filiformis]UBQ55580.1 hypothetical protein JF568_08290 [Alysiella filiformis DSM 16848]SOD67551.1 Predicted chitinase [Alysiella filiformis DSM 16848]